MPRVTATGQPVARAKYNRRKFCGAACLHAWREDADNWQPNPSGKRKAGDRDPTPEEIEIAKARLRRLPPIASSYNHVQS